MNKLSSHVNQSIQVKAKQASFLQPLQPLNVIYKLTTKREQSTMK